MGVMTSITDNYTTFQTQRRVLITAEEYVRSDTVLMANQTCHTLEQDHYIVIRKTTAILSHNRKERRAVIAMDPCSNSTNIDEDFA